MNINKGPITGPKYLPHMQHKDVISMGMESIDRRHWIEPDASYPQFLEHKLSLKGITAAAYIRRLAECLCGPTGAGF